MTSTDLGRHVTVSRSPRSAHYDPVWLVDNMMGPCSVWRTEALTDVMPLAPVTTSWTWAVARRCRRSSLPARRLLSNRFFS